ncbi:MAG: PEP-CTERM sorting domain-containing protein [Terriglobia bacterium]
MTALNDGVSASPTPEPGTLLLFGTALLGVMGLLLARRERTSIARMKPSAERFNFNG